MKKISLVWGVAVLALTACTDSFKKGDEGVEYKIISKGSGDVAKYGEFLHMHVAQFYNNGKTDSLLSDTRTSPQGAAFEVMDTTNMPPTYYKILRQLKKGDSLVIRILVDSAFKNSPQGIPPFFQKGHYLLTTAKVLDIYKTREQADSARMIAMQQAQDNMKKLEAEMLIKDDKTLQDYFKKNNIQVQKAPKGTYVQVLQAGTGAAIDTGVVVKTNYTGTTMEGKKFDSNTDPAFNHVEPLLVNMTSDPSLGTTVIPGWTDGMTLLSKGAKAKFYIPSALAYGSQAAGPDIKPNSILVFDVEILDVLNRQQAQAAAAASQQRMQAMQQKMMDSLQKAQPQQKAPGQ